MDEFVCVRIVQANAMDLTLFQFDFDLTFAVFFMNADKTIYGRFGSRSTRKNATGDISIDGLRKAMAAVLKLHESKDGTKLTATLAAKRGAAPRFRRPEKYPALHGKYKPELDYRGKVVQSCMHCHQILDAERALYRSKSRPIPDEVLYPWPMPQTLGMTLDPNECATIRSVAKGSVAGMDGFQPGNVIRTLEGQPLVSIADVQWVLHTASENTMLRAKILRGGNPKTITLSLPKHWRRNSDIRWRVSTWDLRRMGTGGLVMEEMTDAARKKIGIADTEIALLVQYVGWYGAHAVAKRAGFRKGDVIVAVDGQKKRMSDIGFIAYAVQKKKPGNRIDITVLRGGKHVKLKLPMQ